jgi:UDP-glucuronate 4-epimerase
VFNNGQLQRDFTFVDDVVEGVLRIAERPPQAPPASATADAVACLPPAPAAIYNIGNNNPVELDRLIAALEASLGRQAIRRNCGMQPGDMLTTYADVGPLGAAVGFSPATNIEEGVARFVAWYVNYHAISPPA